MRNASQTPSRAFRQLPAVDRLVRDALAADPDADPVLLTELAREMLAHARRAIAAGAALGDLAADLRRRLAAAAAHGPHPLINATGVIVHTNLGRAPLSAAARRAMEAVAAGYSDLEYDLETGERGSRHAHLDDLLRRVTGAEAGLAVNNNAAAVLLVLAALCAGREVIISRGQLVEIGGGFRIPDVLRQSGARLVEVGTTNRTYAADYEAAITDQTAALLRVHPSNFRITGFVHEPEPAALAALARARGVLLLDDLGSGCLLDTAAYGLPREPTVAAALRAGADLVMCSGDKLLGGPQAGIIAGRANLVERVRRHPLARAVRLDKASLAALAATLGHYRRGEAEREIPIWRMIAATPAALEARAAAWAAALGPAAAVIDARSAIGGGSLPEVTLPSRALALRSADPDALARALRQATPPIVARIEDGRVLLDPRTVHPDDDATLLAALHSVLAAPPEPEHRIADKPHPDSP